MQSVLDGYNGTVMAYGQTGTGKTYTLGRMGKDDDSKRGIMVRALEDITTNTSPTSDCVEISYLQVLKIMVMNLLTCLFFLLFHFGYFQILLLSFQLNFLIVVFYTLRL